MMIKSIAVSILTSLAWRLARMAQYLTHEEPSDTAAPDPERYTRKLDHLDLARADGLLGYAFGNETSGILWGQFTKSADSRWVQ